MKPVNNKFIECKARKQWSVRLWSRAMIPLMVVALLSCDVGEFGDMNVNPTQVSELDPELQFTTVQLGLTLNRGEDWLSNILYAKVTPQQISRPGAGDNYGLNIGWAVRLWNDTMRGGVGGMLKNTQDLVIRLENMLEEGEPVANKLAKARIMRVFMFHRVTDMYGDMPYFEAGMGFHEQIYTPTFDPQEVIYNDMLNELAEAVAQLDPALPSYGSADLMYQGDIDKWRKFGNSMRLRLAMRLTGVDPDKARTESVAALNAPGGVMTSNDDIALIWHEVDARTFGPHSNGIANTLAVDSNVYLSQRIVDWMKERNDPRLRVYGAVLPEGYGGPVITDPEEQQGRPNGWGNSDIPDHPRFPGDINLYSRAHPRFLDVTNPTFFQTYAEVELLQAEMAVRDWIGSSEEMHYNNGVRAAMEYLALYSGDDSEITDVEINTYLSANPFSAGGTMDEQLEQINTQYWAALFWNGFEAWANFRRSGYPVLERSPVDSDEPHPTSVTGGDFTARLVYPETEQVLNQENFNEVLERQGPNTLSTPVWWDPQIVYRD